jgi:hypothetical protein
MDAKFKIGERIIHHRYGKGIILGNYHKRGGNWFWHVQYDNGTFGYNTEQAMKSLER